ncbi:TonB-dependent receptor [Sphingomonas sp. GC_Shp_3]|uniref:TonB-dependent receptor plug domain-containing protein n=1 Tax=Sphingomonas sp. GC_Shp_3 TaxID=2937383 RepID=UPI00226AC131|nr:TonB-dependent receptor [Sphingomonas sp. GC_Shp_3]
MKIAISLFALIATTPVLAQTAPDDGTATDTVVVTAARAPGGISTATLGSSATVVTAQDLSDRQTVIVSDVLRDVPGISVNRTGAVGGMTQVRIRGAESNHTLVLIDGIEAADPYYGEYDFASLTADPGARVEVLRGEQSALYGSDAIGGVINYITPTGREMPGFAGRIEAGSFNTVDGAVRGAGTAGDFDYAVGGSYSGIGGYVVAPAGDRRIGSKIGTVNGKFGYQSEDFGLRGVVRYTHIDADVNDQDYAVTGNAIDSGGSYLNDAVYALVGAHYSALEGRWSNDLSAQLQESQRRFLDDNGTETSGDTGRRKKVSFVSALKLGGDAASHVITGAVDYEHESYQGTSAFITGSNPFRDTNNWGLVGQYQVTVGSRLGLGGAVRHDVNQRFRDATTWHLQASYRFDTGTRIHAAGGTGVKAPVFSELFGYSPTSGFVGNPNLKPEESTGWEAGVEQSFLAGHGRIDVTYFNAVLRHKIVSTFDPVYTVVNATGSSPHQGVEVALNFDLPAGFRFDGSYTYLDAHDEADMTLIRRPAHIGSANLAWRSKDDRFGANVTVRYNGDALDTNFATYQTETLQAYTLVNFGADVAVARGISVFGRVENLLDTDFRENVGFRGSPRAGYGGIKARI